jgi:hypothetical protein
MNSTFQPEPEEGAAEEEARPGLVAMDSRALRFDNALSLLWMSISVTNLKTQISKD